MSSPVDHVHECRDCGAEIPAGAACTTDARGDCDWPGGDAGCERCAAAPVECLDAYQGDCAGTIEYRMALSGTGTPFLRCDRHWSERLDREEETRERYPDHPPSDWSPYDAGESWDDE